MTCATVSIEPGSVEALAITAGELRVMHYTGRSVSRGYGRDNATTTVLASRLSSVTLSSANGRP